MNGHEQGALSERSDFQAIGAWVKPDSSVLDLGCGDGVLLKYLRQTRNARGYGIEIDDANVLACVKNGVNVIQSDLERGLAGFDAGSFDCVILSQTLQAMRHTEEILSEMLRVGRQAIVSFPNFGQWRHAVALLAGRMPVTPEIPYQWYDTPNIRVGTYTDCEVLLRKDGFQILDGFGIQEGRAVRSFPNLMASVAVFKFQRG